MKLNLIKNPDGSYTIGDYQFNKNLDGTTSIYDLKDKKKYEVTQNDDGTYNIHDVEIFKLGKHITKDGSIRFIDDESVEIETEFDNRDDVDPELLKIHKSALRLMKEDPEIKYEEAINIILSD